MERTLVCVEDLVKLYSQNNYVVDKHIHNLIKVDCVIDIDQSHYFHDVYNIEENKLI